jgi:hypothetical protein
VTAGRKKRAVVAKGALFYPHNCATSLQKPERTFNRPEAALPWALPLTGSAACKKDS